MEKLKPKLSLSEQAYKAIKKSIINNQVQPMEYLVEEKIAMELGISRTPIRDALKKLAFDGLIEFENGSRARVSKVTPEDVVDYQVIREQLEVLAVKLASSKFQPKDIRKLKDLCNKQEKTLEEKDFYQFVEYDFEFHNYIAIVSNNKPLISFLNNISDQILRFLVLTDTLQESAIGAINEHRAIIEALVEGDEKKAGDTMRCHIRNVSKRIISSSE